MPKKQRNTIIWQKYANDVVFIISVNVVRATVDALKQLEEPEEIAARRGLALDEVAPDALLRARAAGIAEARKAREEAAAAKAAEEKDGE